jgi:hypothetical protein
MPAQPDYKWKAQKTNAENRNGPNRTNQLLDVNDNTRGISTLLGRAGDKLDRQAVDTVPLVRLGEALAFKHVAQVPPAVLARDLHALHAKRVVHVPIDGAEVVIERWPPAARVEFALVVVQRGVARPAHKDAPLWRGDKAVVLARARALRPLLPQDMVLLRREALLPLRLGRIHASGDLRKGLVRHAHRQITGSLCQRFVDLGVDLASCRATQCD